MANDLVVQLGAKLDQFASDMNQAGDIADSAVSRIEQSFANLNPGVGTAFGALATGGLLLGLQKILSVVADANKALADMNTEAKQVGLSLADFQSLKYAANVKGVTDDKFLEGLQQSASLLNDAQRNANSLSKLFEKNGDSIRNSNGELITENQLLNQAAKYIANAGSEQDKIKIAQMVGLTRDWVPLLENGVSAFRELSAEAASVGAVIDDDTIEKATEFDEAWRKSSVQWSVYMRAALAGVLPVIDDILERAAKLIPSREQVKQAVDSTYKAMDEAGIPKEGGLKIGVTPETADALKDFREATNVWDGIVSALRALKGAVQVIGPEESRKIAASQPITPERPSDEEIKAAFNKRYNEVHGNSDAQGKTGPTQIPARDQAADAYDRARESVEKYTARIQAEADATGRGAQALGEFKAEAQLVTAAQQAGIPITDKVKDQIQDLAQDAGDAAAALAKAKVDLTISRGQQTGLLSPEDVAIANQLKDLYPDVATALASVEAQALRTNQAFSQISSQVSNDLTAGLTDIATGAKTASQGFSDMAKSILRDIEQVIIKLYIVGPLMRTLGIGGGLFGGLTSAGGIAGAVGATSVGGLPLVPAFASGTNSAPGGWSLVGENGPELVNLSRGAQVIPNDVLRSSVGGNVSAPVTISIDARGADQAAVSRLMVSMDQLQRNLPKQISSVVKRQQTRGVVG